MRTKKFLLLLALIMCLASSSTVFASEPAEVEKHTITIEVAPAEEVAMPLIWDQNTILVMNGGSFDLPSFDVSDKFFAYESTVTGPNGESINQGKFAVALMRGSSIKASTSGDPDGSTYKHDWITMSPGTYYFRLLNNSPAVLRFHITYYSWNT